MTESSDYLFEFIDDLPIGIARTDTTLETPNYYNHFFGTLFGWRGNEIDTLEKWFSRAYPDEAYRSQVVTLWHELVDETESKGQYFSRPVEVMVACSDGSVKWCEVRYYRKSHFVYGIFVDIQAQKEARSRLRESHQKLQGLFDLSPLGIALTDMTGRYLEYNEAFRRICGYPDEELVKLDYWTLTPEKYKEQEARQLELLAKTGYYGPYEKEYRQKDGTLIPINLNGMLLTDAHGQTFIWSIVEDITERRKSAQALQEQRDFLNAIFNSVTDGIMVLDADYNVTMSNKTIQTLAGEHEGGLKCYELSHQRTSPCEEDISHPCPLRETIANKAPSSAIHTHYDAQGARHVVEVTTVPLYNEAGEVVNVIETTHEITELIKAKENLQYQAEHDALTGLPNRSLFLDRLNQAVKRARRHDEKIAVLYLDLDRFKEVNDTLGHLAGDALLISIAKHLEENFRQSDTIARLGGDEFAIIIERFHEINAVIDVIQKLIVSLNEPKRIAGRKLYTTFSIGIALYPDDAQEPMALLKQADTAMYKAKNEGRNNYQFYTSDMTAQAFERMTFESHLRETIQKNGLEVHYQLQFDAQSETLLGMEALVRWNSPYLGHIPPSKFIPLAEDTGLIKAIDTFVMQSAFKQYMQWKNKGLKPGKLSLNLSQLHIKHGEIVTLTKQCLEQYAMQPTDLVFEITESRIMKDPDEAMKIFSELNALGIELAIDDFGTGHSSLAYLKKLPIDKLKIDQSFIRDIPEDRDDCEIVRTIIAMAKNLRLSVIAEGVETQAQKAFLLENGCSEIQGFLFHRPKEAAAIEAYLVSQAAGAPGIV